MERATQDWSLSLLRCCWSAQCSKCVVPSGAGERELFGIEGERIEGVAKIKACARCRLAYYCSRECQRVDWKAGHKDHCRVVDISYEVKELLSAITAHFRSEIGDQLKPWPQAAASWVRENFVQGVVHRSRPCRFSISSRGNSMVETFLQWLPDPNVRVYKELKFLLDNRKDRFIVSVKKNPSGPIGTFVFAIGAAKPVASNRCPRSRLAPISGCVVGRQIEARRAQAVAQDYLAGLDFLNALSLLSEGRPIASATDTRGDGSSFWPPTLNDEVHETLPVDAPVFLPPQAASEESASPENSDAEEEELRSPPA